MKKLRYLRYLCVLLLTILSMDFTAAQPNRDKDVATDNTDYPIRKKHFIWGERIDDTSGRAMKKSADIWYSKYTPSYEGFIELKTGEIIDGDLVKRFVYNKSATQKVNIDGKKQDDPDGIEYNEIHLTNTKGKNVYKLDELKPYGLYYTTKDYDSNEYIKGAVYLTNGAELKGLVRTVYWSSPYKGMKYYGRVYYAKDEMSNVECYHSEEVDKVTSVNNSNQEIVYNKLGDWLITGSQFNKSFADYAKENKFEPMTAAEVTLQDGLQLYGKVSFGKGAKKNQAFFVNKTENLYLDLTKADVSSIKAKGSYYIREKGKFVSFDERYAKWQKKGELLDAHVVFENGKELEGKLVFTTTQNAIKSYRDYNGFYLISNSTENGVQTFKASYEVDYIEVLKRGKKEKYVTFNNYFVEFDKFYN